MSSPDPLAAIRQSIDAVDARIVDLLVQRAQLVGHVGDTKKKEGLQIYAPQREKALLDQLDILNNKRLPQESLHAIYREIMSMSLHLEDDLSIAFLGPEGTWTHQAAIEKFGHSVRYLSRENFAEVFESVERQKAHYGVVPIENSTEGAVTHTLDLFVDSPLKICSQILLPINNALLASIDRQAITTLYSHPQVFGQCKQWILRHFPQADLVEVSSTTKAAQLASQRANEGTAALGGALAGALHGLHILENSIQDRANNTTRFLVIGHKIAPPTGNDRTSLLFSIKDTPGSLVLALQSFERLSVNLSKIESRPSKQRDWEYIFFVDLNGHQEDTKVSQAIQSLQEHCSLVKILGSYPAS